MAKKPKSAKQKVMGAVITGILKPTFSFVGAAGRLGAKLDKKFGTENKSLFRPSDPAKRSNTYAKRKSKGGGGK
tara:strand:- start:38 stop:259 length:222 start_codon:yes stop_codon:yes gene_type:complete